MCQDCQRRAADARAAGRIRAHVPKASTVYQSCVSVNCFIFWDVPGDVLAAPESALCGWIGVVLSLSSLPHPEVNLYRGKAVLGVVLRSS